MVIRGSVQKTPQHRIALWLAAGLVGMAFLLIAVLLVFLVIRPRLESLVRERILQFVQTRFESTAELQSVRLSLMPRVGLSGNGFVLYYHGRKDLPPFISMQHFEADVALFGLLRTPQHLHQVRLDGLQIHLPPREERQKNQQPKKEGSSRKDVVVDEVVADGALLDMIPREPAKPHHIFHLYKLTIHSASASQPMTFETALSNPKPPGLILSHGTLGPWQVEDPGLTPVSGSFHFENADLGAFRTIAGILSSRGSYKGALERIEVDGHTDTPDFMVRASGHPVHLRTSYHSIVDGTNGDTVLDPVVAEFLHSRIIARGSVTQTEGTHGRTVILDVTGAPARMEDLLTLGVKSQPPPMSGALDLHTSFRLPPGKERIIEKLSLDGTIAVRSGQFANQEVQKKVDTLSEKARGDAGKNKDKEKEDNAAPPPDRVLSNLQVRFRLNSGKLTVPHLVFTVPGADVSLNGSTTLAAETLDFRGDLKLAATLSETTTGVKSFLLKLVDPFFKSKKQNAGAVVPIKVTGTLKHPSFGLNLGGSKKEK